MQRLDKTQLNKTQLGRGNPVYYKLFNPFVPHSNLNNNKVILSNHDMLGNEGPIVKKWKDLETSTV